ncbi:MAG: patatin-like phospholipase family protein [Bacteroidetes bacterium]|nr:patatin-like phospholipase family protein [Bacteroidota bacterium]
MKRALVISGGGSKGAFAVGVLKQLFHIFPNLDFDIFVGSSAGSLVVSLAALNQMDTLSEIYSTISNDNLFIEGNIVDKLGDTSLFDVTPAWNLIQNKYPDQAYDQLQASGKKVFLTTVCLQTNELNVFTNDALSIKPGNYKVVQTLDANHYRRALLASCCEPVFMQPIQIARNVAGAAHPEYQYVDGGVLKYVGIEMAIDAGATEIFTILLSPDKSTLVKDQFTNLMSILGETVDILTSSVGKTDVAITDQYAAALKYIDDVKTKMKMAGIDENDIKNYFTLPTANIFQDKEPIKIFKIRPDDYLGGGPGGLTFDPSEMQGMMAKGITAFNQFAANLPSGDVTWV